MRRLAAYLCHVGFLAALAALALKAVLPGPRGDVTLSRGECAELAGETFVLKDFRVEKYPSGKPSQFVSDIHFVPKVEHASISVNHPLRRNGFWLYQTSYDAAHERYTVLTAYEDPWLPLAVIAGACLLLGTGIYAVLCAAGPRPAGEGGRRAPLALRLVAAAALTALPVFVIGRALMRPEPMPALQSPFLLPHVGAYLVSYVILFFAAFGMFTRWIGAAFFLMTLGLVLGAAWGKVCWTDWWQYDPKEMWSLATWLAFALHLHFRRRWMLWAGAVLIVLTLTWVNVSRLFAGMHSYA